MEKNYNLWSFQMRRFLMGRKLWGYIDGSVPQPKDEIGRIEPKIGRNLTYQSTAKVMWDYLHKIYSQANTACLYTLEQESMKTQQGDSSIHILFQVYGMRWTRWRQSHPLKQLLKHEIGLFYFTFLMGCNRSLKA
ncbi:hypothetical protein AMTRI_Chr09g41160 [Amborella trichopoda]